MIAHRSRTLRIAGWAALLLLAAFAARAVWSRRDELVASFASVEWSASWTRLALSAVLLSAGLLLNPAGWILISRRLGAQGGTAEMLAAWFGSQLGRYMPGKIWLFAGRIGYLRSGGLSLARAASASVWELLCSFASVGLVAGPALLQGGGRDMSGPARTALVAAAAAVFLLPLLKPIQKAAFRLRGIQGSPAVGHGATAAATGIYAAIWLLRGASLWLWLEGLGVGSRGPLQCLAAAPLSWLAGYVMILVPGGIGVREAVTGALVADQGMIAPVIAATLGQTVLMAVIELVSALAFFRFSGKDGGRNAAHPQV